MLTQSDFLERLWKEVIRGGSDGKWLDALITRSQKTKDASERKMGDLLAKLLKNGVTRQEIVALLQWDRYDTAFGIVHMIEEDGIEPEACLP